MKIEICQMTMWTPLRSKISNHAFDAELNFVHGNRGLKRSMDVIGDTFGNNLERMYF